MESVRQRLARLRAAAERAAHAEAAAPAGGPAPPQASAAGRACPFARGIGCLSGAALSSYRQAPSTYRSLPLPATARAPRRSPLPQSTTCTPPVPPAPCWAAGSQQSRQPPPKPPPLRRQAAPGRKAGWRCTRAPPLHRRAPPLQVSYATAAFNSAGCPALQ